MFLVCENFVLDTNNVEHDNWQQGKKCEVAAL